VFIGGCVEKMKMTKEFAKFLIKKNYSKPMASVLTDPRQKSHLYDFGSFTTEA